ncbi:MAG: hypothetical protein E4H40_01300 [Candidatus Brocadiia bacterium]|nr:MAG: hypothetical protein E4H40_01300 [Candidatus Brocadiia bacterium]
MCRKVIVPFLIISMLSSIPCHARLGQKKDTTGVRSSGNQAVIKNVFVAKKPGKFYGWPANGGVWIWGDEILVGIHEGDFIDIDCSHSCGGKGRGVLARSLDGGENWSIEDPENFVGDEGQITTCPGGINFQHPDFAMRLNWTEFYISYDRGKTWQGPYKLPDFKIGQPLTARTDYLISGPSECMFFLSVRDENVHASERDRAFCARTTDGCKNFEFMSWIVSDNITVRSVMPSTVRISDNHLVSALRRRYDIDITESRKIPNCWIDVYESKDNGRTWGFLSMVANTGKSNGNPPSMVRLRDGRLVVTYGVRSVCSRYYYRPEPQGIFARISKDNGQTWGNEIVLRDDAMKWDLGYTRSVQRLDGKIVTIYYFNTKENTEEFIAATIWDPDAVRK